MCEVFSVSHSGYYRWIKADGEEEDKPDTLDDTIRSSFQASRHTYGSPRIVLDLKQQGIEVSASTLRSMRMQVEQELEMHLRT
ncbi:MAG: IS3 family transposase [Lewinella sp.]|uniref:IS3 family transposase n=1 Tax=Lewinella sp. TaxID=2004506 RepID=UPI003D69FE24